jgi:hypothetical protein
MRLINLVESSHHVIDKGPYGYNNKQYSDFLALLSINQYLSIPYYFAFI